MGLLQTLTFARVLSPEWFSLFILVGAIGYSLWLCDPGLAKILFVKLRAAHLARQDRPRRRGAGHSRDRLLRLAGRRRRVRPLRVHVEPAVVFGARWRGLRPVLRQHHAQSRRRLRRPCRVRNRLYGGSRVPCAIAAYRGPVRAASTVALPHWQRAAEPAAAR